MRAAAFLLLSLAAAGLEAANANPPANQSPDVIFTRQRVFRIPFDIEPAQDAQQRPQEVELHASENHGRQWVFHKAVPPQAKGFVYRASHDGEYWFVVRTINALGQRMPPSQTPDGRSLPTLPEMKVVVDTQRPHLNLQVLPGRAGEIIVRWHAADPNIAVDRPQIHFRQLDRPSRWRLVAVNAGLQGQAALPGLNGPIAIRARIGDKANNVTVQTLHVMSRDGHIQSVTNAPAERPSENAHVQNQPVPGPKTQQAATVTVQKNQPTADASGNAVASSSSPNHQQMNPFHRAEQRTAPAKSATNGAQKVAHTTDSTHTGQDSQQAGDMNQPPEATHRVMVKSLRFLLEYEVDEVGSSGIKSLVLYGTRNGGKSWRAYAVDSDMQSPIEVTVPGEGEYGFKMVVESGSGVGGTPPRSGSDPEIWVTVDATKPTAQFTGFEHDGSEMGQLRISWAASDEHLNQKAISLFFSGSNAGPWYPIVEGIPNTGQYAWRLDKKTPRPLHIRLVVEDEAKNKTIIQNERSVLGEDEQSNTRIRMARPFMSRFGGRTRL